MNRRRQEAYAPTDGERGEGVTVTNCIKKEKKRRRRSDKLGSVIGQALRLRATDGSGVGNVTAHRRYFMKDEIAQSWVISLTKRMKLPSFW